MGTSNDLSYRLHVCRWLVVLALGCLWGLSAGATNWDRYTDFYWNKGNGNITAFPGQGSGNMWSSYTKTPMAGGTKATGPTKALPFNPSPTANFSAHFSPGGMARALANPAVMVPLLAFPIIDYLLEEACVQMAGGTYTLAPGGQWQECRFGPQATTLYTTCMAPGCSYQSGQLSTPQEAEVYGNNKMTQLLGTATYVSTPYTQQAGSFYVMRSSGLGSSYQWLVTAVPGTTTVQVGWDPIPASAAETKLAAKLDAWTQCDFSYGYGACAQFDNKASKDVLDALMNSGQSVEMSGASAQGQTQLNSPPRTETTTNTTNNTTTNTTTNTTNNYTYNNPAPPGTTITITHNAVSTVTTTTVNNSTQQVTNQSTTTTQEDKQPEEKDPCEKDSSAIGCAKLDTVEGPELPKTTKTLTYQAEDVMGGGACPSDKFAMVGGYQVKAWDWQSSCGYITTYVKPVILAAAAFIALIIIMPGGWGKSE